MAACPVGDSCTHVALVTERTVHVGQSEGGVRVVVHGVSQCAAPVCDVAADAHKVAVAFQRVVALHVNCSSTHDHVIALGWVTNVVR